MQQLPIHPHVRHKTQMLRLRKLLTSEGGVAGSNTVQFVTMLEQLPRSFHLRARALAAVRGTASQVALRQLAVVKMTEVFDSWLQVRPASQLSSSC